MTPVSWHSKKFWQTLAAQAVGLAAILGLVAKGDVAGLTAAAAAVVANAWVVVHFLKTGHLEMEAAQAPADDMPAGSPPRLLPLILLPLVLLALASPAHAQLLPRRPQWYVYQPQPQPRLWGSLRGSPPHTPPPQVHRTFALGLIAINGQRSNVPQQPAPAPQVIQVPAPASGTDPATIAMLNQISSQNQQILALLMQIQSRQLAAPAAPAPPTIITAPGGSSKPNVFVITLPWGNQATPMIVPGPAQPIAVPSQPQLIVLAPQPGATAPASPATPAPAAPLPQTAPAPLQVLPPSGAPLQVLPVQPSAPPQALPVMPPSGSPLQVLPVEPPGPPQALPVAPAGYQRYVIYRLPPLRTGQPRYVVYFYPRCRR